eukprot:CAMPEP_0119127686 /NCGR_PEP_ID=MMETSP1310-20130426/6136_1 /TAXON_ID=464262 /ORGANISM="Genus nov. species nov., Strain RCC2339" /LENGTH=188 /DNA_ID=CAMNT_0007117965 /DNA_START=106 /DNA_END=668 /DNA_ORIENTATION=+
MSLLPQMVRLRQTIQAIREKGFKDAFRSFWYYSNIRYGTLVGVDAQGNKYYENEGYYVGRNRWIEYADYKNYDASQVDASWFCWLHHTVEHPPTHPDVQKLKPFWLQPHKPNMTGTDKAYFPPGHFFNREHNMSEPLDKHNYWSGASETPVIDAGQESKEESSAHEMWEYEHEPELEPVPAKRKQRSR